MSTPTECLSAGGSFKREISTNILPSSAPAHPQPQLGAEVVLFPHSPDDDDDDHPE